MTGYVDYIRPAANYTTRREDLRERGNSRGELPAGPMSVQALRDFARANGLDLGNEREDKEDRARTIEHESAHVATAHSLGWTVESVSIDAGATKITMPDFQTHDSLAQRNLEYAVIAASGAAFTGISSDRGELLSDRWAARSKGVDFVEARRKAVLLTKDRGVRALFDRVVAALTVSGTLEGAELARVLEDR
jgi:hypothetical protein